MMARLKEGQSIKQVIAWAKYELEGFTPLTFRRNRARLALLHVAAPAASVA